MKKILCSIAALASFSGAAQAATYVFDVNYSGGNNAALASGSDNPLGVTLSAGDSYTYSLSATGAGEWTTLSSGSIFPFFSLYGPFNSSIADVSLTLSNNGISVLNFAEAGIATCCGHIGTNTVSFAGGLVFDKIELVSSIISTGASGPAFSLLPWPGEALEVYRPGLISYTQGNGAVPEPAAWAMMLAGFGLVGSAMRRREKVAVTFA